MKNMDILLIYFFGSIEFSAQNNFADGIFSLFLFIKSGNKSSYN